MSEYLERQIYERLFKSEPSIVKLIENKSDLSKLSTLNEPSQGRIQEFLKGGVVHYQWMSPVHVAC